MARGQVGRRLVASGRRQSCGSCKNADDQPRLSVVAAATLSVAPTRRQRLRHVRHLLLMRMRRRGSNSNSSNSSDSGTCGRCNGGCRSRLSPPFSHAHIIIAIDASCTRCTRCTRDAFSTLSSWGQIRCVVYDSTAPPHHFSSSLSTFHPFLESASSA